jgi:hypothetical protein
MQEGKMKRLLMFASLLSILGGCVVLPVGYPEHEHGYRSYGYNDGYRWHDQGGYRWRNEGYRH